MSIVLFFFQQKTAYEMRISDWSSDVCSSDLRRRPARPLAGRAGRRRWRSRRASGLLVFAQQRLHSGDLAAKADRSEARRVGKECVSTCRSRGSDAHLKTPEQTVYLHDICTTLKLSTQHILPTNPRGHI